MASPQTRPASTELLNSLNSNNHCAVVMTPAEFIDFAITQKRNARISDAGIIKWIDNLISNSQNFPEKSKKQWAQRKGQIKEYGSFLPVFSDSLTLGILAAEMKRSGNILAKYRINTYSGQSYVILEGYPGLRNQLRGTRYLANNPRVVSMGIGKLGAARAIKGGVVISIIFSVGFHALEQLINDQATWHDFVAGVSVDLVSAAAGAAIAWGVVSTVVGATAMAAIGPIAIVVVAGALLTTGFNALSDHFELSQRLAGMLKEAENRMKETLEETKREIRRGLNYADEDPVGFMHRLFGVPYFGPSR